MMERKSLAEARLAGLKDALLSDSEQAVFPYLEERKKTVPGAQNRKARRAERSNRA